MLLSLVEQQVRCQNTKRDSINKYKNKKKRLTWGSNDDKHHLGPFALLSDKLGVEPWGPNNVKHHLDPTCVVELGVVLNVGC